MLLRGPRVRINGLLTLSHSDTARLGMVRLAWARRGVARHGKVFFRVAKM